uniref:Pseudouridine synthase II N-terminal domain-containing protein n=1 Tax=Ornithorhynchus anatinus TaxID=9258 RepID=A0A6I8NWW7_ORNAN
MSPALPLAVSLTLPQPLLSSPSLSLVLSLFLPHLCLCLCSVSISVPGPTPAPISIIIVVFFSAYYVPGTVLSTGEDTSKLGWTQPLSHAQRLNPHLKNEVNEAQRSEVTCPRSHSRQVAEPRLELTTFGCPGLCSIHYDYTVHGLLGKATDDFSDLDRLVERIAYNHVTQEKLDSILAVIQGSHEKALVMHSRLDPKTQEACGLAVKGSIRSIDKTPRLILRLRCLRLSPPEFQLELKSTQMRHTQDGAFAMDDTLLRMQWDLCSVQDSSQEAKCHVEEELLKTWEAPVPVTALSMPLPLSPLLPLSLSLSPSLPPSLSPFLPLPLSLPLPRLWPWP